ncbi:hypothetical protein HYFRA_00011007 [Hymenoscyphus fraxineus]|uniref:Uncharacterized protein n=1 Tax=Hymenoscyphus fraxineus TaxID=746836 RepID=A0A9N9KZ69_9HELO|nr:hypothetical protein HYFRA_00011007 [Hymenoscyphus fraxineus]
MADLERPVPGQSPEYGGMVLDGSSDIATNVYGDTIVVGVTGRLKGSSIFIRTGQKGNTTIRYNALTDAPTQPISLIPTTEEREGRSGTSAYLVVGVILAKEPLKFDTTRTGLPGQGRDNSKKEREHLAMTPDILRAVVPLTDHITNAADKYYVACNQTQQLCELRLTVQNAIFYFDELWANCPSIDVLDVKKRGPAIDLAVRQMAARDKTPPKRAMVNVGNRGDNNLRVSANANEANEILFDYAIFAKSGSDADLKVLVETLKRIEPTLSQKPSSAAVSKFYQPNSLTNEEAVEISDIAKNLLGAQCPAGLSPELVLCVHQSLLRTKLRGDLAYSNFLPFLKACSIEIHPRNQEDFIDSNVKVILEIMKIVSDTTPLASPPTLSSMNKDDMTLLLSAIRKAVIEARKYMIRSAEAMRSQHGGIADHTNLEELMTKIGKTVDVTTRKVLTEQVFAIHAEQWANVHIGTAKYLDKIIERLDRLVGA